MKLFSSFSSNFLLKNKNSLIWDSSNNSFKNIESISSIELDLLKGIDSQKRILLQNSENFANGNFTNNALLWGSRGNGKSTLVKSIFIHLSKKYNNIRLIQLNKNDILHIEDIYRKIEKFKKLRFILFIDDLSFEKIDENYKLIKSTLDGSIQNQPKNIIIYITSNRRHLMSREMIDNERSSAIHTDESVEEKISLSDRFGLWIGFHNLSQNDYIEIVKSYCKYYKIEITEEDIKNSIQWSIQRGNRNGRTAWQYILQIASNKNLQINF